MSLLGDLVNSVLEFPSMLVSIASHDPIAAVLLVVGGILLGVSSVVFGVLVLGGLLSLLRPGGGGRSYPVGR